MLNNLKSLESYTKKWVEVEKNTRASDYIIDNYNKLCTDVVYMKMVDESKAVELIHTVYEVVVKKEENGYGFRECTTDINGNIIGVDNMIYGLLSGYSKGKYFKGTGDLELKGEILDLGKVREVIEQYKQCIISEEDKLISDLDLREELEYLEFIGNRYLKSTDIKYFILNIHEIVKNEIDLAIFEDINILSKANKDFKEALESVISYVSSSTCNSEKARVILEKL